MLPSAPYACFLAYPAYLVFAGCVTTLFPLAPLSRLFKGLGALSVTRDKRSVATTRWLRHCSSLLQDLLAWSMLLAFADRRELVPLLCRER